MSYSNYSSYLANRCSSGGATGPTGPTGTQNLAQTLVIGNNAGATGIDMNGQSISNVPIINNTTNLTIQNGTQNQTSIKMGTNLNAYWTNVTGTAATTVNAKFGCYSVAPHRMKALGYSTADQLTANNGLAGLNGPYFGRATLVAGAVTVANASIGANDLIFITPIGGTPSQQLNAGLLHVAISAGVSFTITSSGSLDTRTVNYMIVINTA